MCPGRSSPELASALYQLEVFARHSPDLKTGYMEKETAPFVKDPHLLSAEEFPELIPYKSLDASRLKIIGEGQWRMADYLDGPLWLPFQEPSFLLHGQPVSHECMPNFKAEEPLECLKLAKVWDSRGLLFLCPQPLVPGHFSRVFNAFKDRDRDRQIGDRRLPNMHEYHIDGPSKNLPQGSQLTCLRIPRFTHVLRGSMTDRRDFYHQAKVTPERSQSNMLPFAFPVWIFRGPVPWIHSWLIGLAQPLPSGRLWGTVWGSLDKSPPKRKAFCLTPCIHVLPRFFRVITLGSNLP